VRVQHWYDYAIVRLVPRPEREEFINVGAIVSCAASKFLGARIELDEARVLAFDASVDLDLMRAHLAAIPLICAGGRAAGPIGKLSQRERFHWLVAPRSAVIQTSAVHTGYCADPALALAHLVQTMVHAAKARSDDP
jgi:hypothetical protein